MHHFGLPVDDPFQDIGGAVDGVDEDTDLDVVNLGLTADQLAFFAFVGFLR